MRASFEEIEDIEPPELSDECQKVIESVRDKLDTLAGDLQGPGSDTIMVLKGVQDRGRLADLTAAHLSLDSSEAQEILEVIDPVERLNRVHRLLELQLQRRQTKDRIEQATRSQMSRNQREYYLREQMRQIRRE